LLKQQAKDKMKDKKDASQEIKQIRNFKDLISNLDRNINLLTTQINTF